MATQITRRPNVGDSQATETKLRQWRRAEGLTIQEVADLTGLSVAMLSYVERGERSLHPRTKVRIGRALRVPLRELFDVEELEVIAS